MLMMMTGMIPADSGSGGSGLDRHTVELLVSELHARQQQLEETREQLRLAQEREGFSAAREEALKALAVELVDNLRKTENLENRLRQTPETTGALTPEELQKKLEEETRRRMLAALEASDNKRMLESLRESQAGTAGDLALLRERMLEMRARQATTEQKLSDTGERLAETRESLKDREARLSETAGQLQQTRETLAARDETLAGTRRQFEETREQMGQVTREAKTLETELTFTRGRLNAAERDLADQRGRLERLRRQAAATEIERNDAKRQGEEIRRLLQNAVTELTQTKAILAQTKTEADTAKTELVDAKARVESTATLLQSVKTQLTGTERKLNADVQERYVEAAVRFNVDLSEKRLLSSREVTGTYYLPLVKLGEKLVIPGFFNTFVGNQEQPLFFDRITRFTCRAAPGTANTEGVTLEGPLYLIPGDPRVGALEVALPECKPLEPISRDRLQQRGLEDLFLFKNGSFGKESASLSGRCSLDFAARDGYLYIRNGGRAIAGDTMLRAEPGDFVLTREGEFVGVVVGVESRDFGRRQEAKCFILPDKVDWDTALSIQILRRPGEEYLTHFAESVRRHLEVIDRLEK